MSRGSDVCLVATCHDPLGLYAPGISAAAPALNRLFSAVAVNATDETHPDTVRALDMLGGTRFMSTHAAGSIGIGTARKDALELGVQTGCEQLFYSDLDHVLRWAVAAPDELEACLFDRQADMLVVGRSASAMAECPERLRRTESIVNHVFGLAHGLAGDWDLMIAMRLMTRHAAEWIVANHRDTAISNDVTWPMAIMAAGGTVECFAGDGIRFLARDDFGSGSDARDQDPVEWLDRVATAEKHIRAIVDHARSGPDDPAPDFAPRPGSTSAGGSGSRRWGGGG